GHGQVLEPDHRDVGGLGHERHDAVVGIARAHHEDHVQHQHGGEHEPDPAHPAREHPDHTGPHSPPIGTARPTPGSTWRALRLFARLVIRWDTTLDGHIRPRPRTWAIVSVMCTHTSSFA